MRKDLRLLSIVGIVLGLPIFPLLLGGLAFERQLTTWLDTSLSTAAAAWLTFGLLAADLVLPVPSSAVSTFAGARLGWWGGTLASWLGMTFGAVVAYWLARTIGLRLARRLAPPRDLEDLERFGKQWGVTLLVALRALPILAEASVVMAGLQKVPVVRFLLAVGLANLAIALFYSVLGEWAAEREWLGATVVASGSIPLGLSVWLRRRQRRKQLAQQVQQTADESAT